MQSSKPTLWGVSFDAVAVSGVVTEFLKIARVFNHHGIAVALDLGYDIKADKGHFFVPYDREHEVLPDWVQLDRLPGMDTISHYHADFIQRWFDAGMAHQLTAPMRRTAAQIVQALTDLLLRHWQQHQVRWVVVENGTLPENTLYTEALYRAIAAHGARHNLGKFVLWRDHDLMWSSETSCKRYGEPPYPLAIAPIPSPHIHYVCLDEQDRQRLRAWAPQVSDITVLPNAFDKPVGPTDAADVRRRLGIASNTYLLARTTRIIGPKRLDRDLMLVTLLNDMLARKGSSRRVHLAIAGDINECRDTYAKLCGLIEQWKLSQHVTFVGHLAPDVAARPGSVTVGALTAAADMVSFLPSYDYDSYGNPVGEAVVAGVAYCATTYARYDAVWGSKGLRGPLLPISASDHEMPDSVFASAVLQLLEDARQRADVVAYNRQRARAFMLDGTVHPLITGLLAAAPKAA